jgi:hypothetical protein
VAKGYLTDRAKISIISTTTAGAAGTSAITSSAVDMAGWEGVTFIVPLGAIVAGAVTSVKVQQSSDDGGSDDYTDISGSAVTIADTDDDKLKYIDILSPGKRYLKVVVSRATQNATIGGIIAIQRFPRSVTGSGITQGTNVAGEAWTAAAEGTA